MKIAGTLVAPTPSGAPGSPVQGQLYFDTSTSILYWYNGSQWISSGGGYAPVSNPTRQILTASGTYTTPAGCNKILVECIGAGGGGGGTAAPGAGQCAQGGGGGGGAYAAKLITSPAASYSFTIGAAGGGGAAGADGTAGGDTIFGSSLVVAKGGGLGQGCGATTAGTAAATGGAGGAANTSTGDVVLAGGNGQVGQPMTTGTGSSSVGGMAGRGGGAMPSSRGTSQNGAAAPTGSYGGGGGGGFAAASTGTTSGAAGNSGLIIVTEFYGAQALPNDATQYLAGDGTWKKANAAPVLRAEAGGTMLAGSASGSYSLNMDSTPKLAATLSNQTISLFMYDPTLDDPPAGFKTQWKVEVSYSTNNTGPGVMTFTFGLLGITSIGGAAGGYTESFAGAFTNVNVAVAFSAAAALSSASSAWVDSVGNISTSTVYALAVFLNAATAANSAVRFRVRLYRRWV